MVWFWRVNKAFSVPLLFIILFVCSRRISAIYLSHSVMFAIRDRYNSQVNDTGREEKEKKKMETEESSIKSRLLTQPGLAEIKEDSVWKGDWLVNEKFQRQVWLADFSLSGQKEFLSRWMADNEIRFTRSIFATDCSLVFPVYITLHLLFLPRFVITEGNRGRRNANETEKRRK